jgi:2-phosphosulfolactate phosphatase
MAHGMQLNVHSLPTAVAPEVLAGGTVVVIDVLRASTTIVYALEAGAAQVVPCLEVGEARKIATQFPRSEFVLGGERQGRRIEGFDLGNSPEEYTTERVSGKTVVFTTTNGTRAMLHARHARRVLIGAFVNARAVCRHLPPNGPIHLLCAGTDGQSDAGDLLVAGMLAARIAQAAGTRCQLNAQAIDARAAWLDRFSLDQAMGNELLRPERLAEALRLSLGGANLIALGLDRDILAASRLDRFQGVPQFDPASGRIRLEVR